jgi:hypothetical protein
LSSKLDRDWSLLIVRGSMTAKEVPSSFTLVSANISCRFVRLDLKSCFEVHLAMYEVVAIGNAQNVENYTGALRYALWHCEHVQKFWKEFVNCLKDNCTNCDRLILNLVW